MNAQIASVAPAVLQNNKLQISYDDDDEEDKEQAIKEEKEPRQESGKLDKSVNSSSFSDGEMHEAIKASLEDLNNKQYQHRNIILLRKDDSVSPLSEIKEEDRNQIEEEKIEPKNQDDKNVEDQLL